MASLMGVVDATKSFVLNSTDDSTALVLLKSEDTTTGFVKSDADEQIIIHVGFQSSVSVSSIELVTSPSFKEDRPTNVKLYINRVSVGFDDVEDAKPAAEFDEFDEVAKLSGPKFVDVNSLTVFVVGNASDSDSTCIGRLILKGTSKQGMDVSKIEKTGDD